MRDINVWAYHAEFGRLCRNAQLHPSSGMRYPRGNRQGQAGWHVAVPYSSLGGLARSFQGGIPMPRQFCGNWFRDCASIRRGEVVRLALLAHGDQGGQALLNGRNRPPITAATVRTHRRELHNIGLMTRRRGSTIILMGCLAGQGQAGTDLLVALSRIWPGRHVVGFSTVGYRHPGEMKRRGQPCELPGMRDTDAHAYLFANPRSFDRQWFNFDAMPWASERSRHAKVVIDGSVFKVPDGEAASGASTLNLSPCVQRVGDQMLATGPGQGLGRNAGPVV